MSNPCFYGNPVPVALFLNRRRELRRVVGRIVGHGQSTAVVGEPRSGKTSLLHYLSAPETRADLYNDDATRLVFSFLDNQALRGECDQAGFWELALRPFKEKVIDSRPACPLVQAYWTCQENAFGTFVLERLLAQMAQDSWRLALLLDEFDVLLHHPRLNCAEFFGGLRSLASRGGGALALVIASRQPLIALNAETQKFSRSGSPYFNFLSEVTLGPLPLKDVSELLSRAGERFSTPDRRFLAEAAGGQPYLLQAGAAALWEAYEDDERDPTRRWRQAGNALYDEAALTLGDTWQQWLPATRKALTLAALAYVPTLLGQRRFHLERLLRDGRDFGAEMRALAGRGFVQADEAVPGGWRVRPQALLWWLADELARTLRPETPFEDWLRQQGWEGLLTRGEKEELGKAVRALGELLKGGAATLIEALAQGLAKGLLGGA